MLYQIYETQRSLMEPFSDFAQVTAKLFANPTSPMGQTPFSQRVAAAYELLHRLGKDYEKPEFGIRAVQVGKAHVAINERVEIDKPFCELRRFKRYCDDPETLVALKKQPVVLIVAPLSGHYATLLRDTVRTMLQDHKVYITDWKNARLVPLSEGEFHLDDYVNYVKDFIRYLQATYGNCHVMSVCQPTVPVLAAVSLMASAGEALPLSMTMMGGPIDARRSPTAVNTMAVHRSFEWFENNVIYRVPPNFPGAGRRVYPGFLQHAGFIAMNPDRHANSHYDYFQDLIKGDLSSAESHRQFYDEYNAVLDMDADYYLETINTVFQEFKLVNGTWDVRNEKGVPERVRPQDIRHIGLLTVEGELDDISGSGQTRAAHDLCTGIDVPEQRHFEVKGAGHYGIFSGRRWREMVYPVVKAFILEHQPSMEGSSDLVKAHATVEENTEIVPPKSLQEAAAPVAFTAPVASPVSNPVATPVKAAAPATRKPVVARKPSAPRKTAATKTAAAVPDAAPTAAPEAAPEAAAAPVPTKAAAKKAPARKAAPKPAQ